MNIQLTDEQHENLIVGALEGGSNYWYLIGAEAMEIITSKHKIGDDEPLSIKFWSAIKNLAVIPIHDWEDPLTKLGEISIQSIEKGEQILADKYPHVLADIIGESDDATTADMWFQLCVMGEVIFG